MSKKNNKVRALLFWAGWCNGGTEMKPKFYDEAKDNGLKYELIDVEEPEGVELSIKYGVRNVPTIVYLKGHKVVGVEKGNNSYLTVSKYVRR
jgi:thioredoxin 1